MRAERALARLDDLQRPIRAALREALPLLDEQDASRFKALSLLRWQVLRLMDAYRRFTHERLLDPLIAARGGRTGPAHALKARGVALAAELDAHVRRWSLQAPLQDWPLYQELAGGLRRRIEAELDHDRATLAALLADRAAP